MEPVDPIEGDQEPPNERDAHEARDSREAREAALRLSLQSGAARSPVGKRILSLYAEAARDWWRAPDAIVVGLRGARELSSVERRFAGDALHELIRLRRRLAFLAGGEAPEAMLRLWLAPPPDADARIAAAYPPGREPALHLAVAASLPDWLARRFVEGFGVEGAVALMAAMNRRASLTVRANLVKTTREALAARLLGLGIASRPTEVAAHGLVLQTRRNVYEMEPFREGQMELQDEASQLVAELCAPPPRGTVIDACAGAGGKTLALGALLGNRGRLLALDVSDKRLGRLRDRARRAGLSNFQTRVTPPEGPPEGTAEADRVLVDAPCSGLGVLRRNPESRWRLGPGDIAPLCATQRALLRAWSRVVRPGGRLIYATCSILPEENDAVVQAFLDETPGFERVPAKEILGGSRAARMGDGMVLRMAPHTHDADGFYAAVFRRRAT